MASNHKPQSVVISGSRKYPKDHLWFVTAMLIEHTTRDDLIITGGAEGVDEWANEEAERLGYATKVMRPEYERYPPKRAPLMRNIAMLEEAPRLVLAFHFGKSSGTAHTIREAYKRGIPFIRFSEDSVEARHQAALVAMDSVP